VPDQQNCKRGKANGSVHVHKVPSMRSRVAPSEQNQEFLLGKPRLLQNPLPDETRRLVRRGLHGYADLCPSAQSWLILDNAQVRQVGRTPSSARDPPVALLRSWSSFKRDSTQVGYRSPPSAAPQQPASV
jgi:hypothetical protein